ncbi:MAG TPA: hypothetical protein VFY83_02820, partial [Anaerolineales bacterium]|nr:hypothetical protein [Anaerolineales bacterium]
RPAESVLTAGRRQGRLALGFGALVLLLVVGIVSFSRLRPPASAATQVAAQCVVEFQEAKAESLLQGGAVIVYNRAAGPLCVDELYAIYPDGRITADDGVNQLERQITSDEVEQLLVAISVDHKWFTNEIYSTYLNPCRQCFAHYIKIAYEGQEKAVTGVDGTTAMPPGYAFALAEIRPLLPSMEPSP